MHSSLLWECDVTWILGPPFHPSSPQFSCLKWCGYVFWLSTQRFKRKRALQMRQCPTEHGLQDWASSSLRLYAAGCVKHSFLCFDLGLSKASVHFFFWYCSFSSSAPNPTFSVSHLLPLGTGETFCWAKKKNHSRESWHDQYHAVTQGELGETRSGDRTWTTTGWVGVSFSVELPGMRCAE